MIVQLKFFAKYFSSEHAICRFQFHNSTIKTICTLDISLRLLNFNSTLVQLKRFIAPSPSVWRLFQFHNGTIKTNLKRLRMWRQSNFNSIMVQLKLQISNLMFVMICNFNSIMVQLKLIENTQTALFASAFQFHNGTIKTCQTCTYEGEPSEISIP